MATKAKHSRATTALEPGAPGPKRLRARALSPSASQHRRAARFPIVGVGASSGGLDAFSRLLGALPADTGMAFVLVQHLDRTHPSLLASALSSTTSMPVIEAEHGERLEPNRVYVTPPDADVRVVDDALALSPRRRGERRLELPIDGFLRSLAGARGSLAIGVVLSGSASDGTEGLKAIKCEGGITLTQEPSEAAFDGMPRSAIEAGAVDRVLPVAGLARELERLSRHPYLASSKAHQELCAEPNLHEIYTALRTAVGVDFSQYKRASFERRLARRMALLRVSSVSEYLRVLRDDPLELSHLHDDALLHQTSFFRDPEVFERLKARVIPELDHHTSLAWEDIAREYVLTTMQDVSRVGLWWGQVPTGDARRTEQREVDVAGVDAHGTLIVAGMCKWTNAPVDFDELNLLDRLIPHIDARAQPARYLFSRAGFAARLVDHAATNPRLHLVTPADIYAD